MEGNITDEGAAGLALASRMFIHLTAKGMIQRENALAILADCQKLMLTQRRQMAFGILQSLEKNLEEAFSDNPVPPG